jgi:hypothetical protein
LAESVTTLAADASPTTPEVTSDETTDVPELSAETVPASVAIAEDVALERQPAMMASCAEVSAGRAARSGSE